MAPYTGTALALDHRPWMMRRAAPEQQRWTCRVARLSGRRHALHLSGPLHVAWAGRLAAGLAARNISVVRATAWREERAWTAEIVFDVLAPGLEPSAIDFLALLRDQTAPRSDEDAVRISRFDLARSPLDVVVEIFAEDGVGFLGRLLREFAAFGLFPHEMRVETVGGEVRDVFRLQGMAGQPPPEGIVVALERRLGYLARRG